MERDNQRIVITKRLLKEALLRLLEEKNIADISITELCNEAEINRATFYRHYTVPRDLLAEIETDFVARFQGKDGSYGSIEEMADSLRRFCASVYQKADLVKRLLRNSSVDEAVELLSRFYREYLWARGRDGGVRPLNEDSIALVSDYLAGGGYYMIRHWLTGDIKKTPEEFASLILGITNLDYIYHWAEGSRGE